MRAPPPIEGRGWGHRRHPQKALLITPPLNAERRAGRCRGQRAGDVSHQRSHLLGRGEALDQRRRPDLRKEVLLELVEGLSIGLGERVNEIGHATRFRWPRQDAVDGDPGAGERLGQTARNGNLCRLGGTVVDHLSRNLHAAFAGNEDDAPPVRASHRGQAQASETNPAQHIGSEEAHPVGVGDFVERLGLETARLPTRISMPGPPEPAPRLHPPC